MLAGTGLEAYGAAREGISASNALNAEAASMERRSGEEKAAAQRDAIQRRREANIVLSRQQAVAASSGGTATDPTVLNIMGDTAAEGQYQVGTALYEGDVKAAGLLDQAAINRARARQARLSGFIKAGTTMLNGFSGMSKGGSSSSFGSSSSTPSYRYG